MRAKSFIAGNIHRYDLTSGDVAVAIGVSERYLRDLFAGEGMSLGRYIWASRLERCRAALSDPSQAHRAISEIAFAWGFNDMSHFSHYFRERGRRFAAGISRVCFGQCYGPISERSYGKRRAPEISKLKASRASPFTRGATRQLALMTSACEHSLRARSSSPPLQFCPAHASALGVSPSHLFAVQPLKHLLASLERRHTLLIDRHMNPRCVDCVRRARTDA